MAYGLYPSPFFEIPRFATGRHILRGLASLAVAVFATTRHRMLTLGGLRRS